MVTHDMRAAAVARRVLRIVDGSIQPAASETGAPRDWRSLPLTPTMRCSSRSAGVRRFSPMISLEHQEERRNNNEDHRITGAHGPGACLFWLRLSPRSKTNVSSSGLCRTGAEFSTVGQVGARRCVRIGASVIRGAEFFIVVWQTRSAPVQ